MMSLFFSRFDLCIILYKTYRSLVCSSDIDALHDISIITCIVKNKSANSGDDSIGDWSSLLYVDK